MKKRWIRNLALLMLGVLFVMTPANVYAEQEDGIVQKTEESLPESSDTATGTDTAASSDVEEDKVTVGKEDKPYLALGADLSAEQQHTVMELMGIKASELAQYDVVYVNNAEEHEYLGDYISSEAIGTRSLSSVVIMKAEKGEGINITTYNINYCTKGMYKNAMATAGISDANVIVAGPFELSGTAALVGIFKAYTQMTGEEIDAPIIDAAMDELVTTGELEAAIDGNAEDVEAMIAELKMRIANGELQTDEEITAAIEEVSKKYSLNLEQDEVQSLLKLLNKLKELDLDWDAIADQASQWADKLDVVIHSEGFWEKLKSLLKALLEWLKSLF